MPENDIVLYEGTALPLDASHELANAFPTRVVLLMGERSAGKTTLLAEIHHAFLQAPFAGLMFAGSRTLIGFEERCFLARISSGQDKEDTERTKYADIRLLHLALAPIDAPESRTNFLLTDVSGERFKEIRANIDDARELAPLIRRAEHVVLLVDGDRLSVAKTQMATETNACVLLRCLMEAGGLDNAGALHVVTSKWDFVVARSAEDRALQLEDSVRRVTGSITPMFHRVASRVTNPVAIPPAFGIAELVQSWMAQVTRAVPVNVADADLQSDRLYQRYRFPSRTL